MELTGRLKASAYVTAFLLGLRLYLPTRHLLETYGEEAYDFSEGRGRRPSMSRAPAPFFARRQGTRRSGGGATTPRAPPWQHRSRDAADAQLRGAMMDASAPPLSELQAIQALRGYRSRSARTEPDAEPEGPMMDASAPPLSELQAIPALWGYRSRSARTEPEAGAEGGRRPQVRI